MKKNMKREHELVKSAVRFGLAIRSGPRDPKHTIRPSSFVLHHTLRTLDEVHTQFHDCAARVTLNLCLDLSMTIFLIKINISCRENQTGSFRVRPLSTELQSRSVTPVCIPFPQARAIYIEHQYLELVLKDDSIESTL